MRLRNYIAVIKQSHWARSARGFTLLEIVITMVIIAILMATAIPLFLGQRQKAAATQAKQDVVTAWKSVQHCISENQTGDWYSPTNCGDPVVLTSELSVPVEPLSLQTLSPGSIYTYSDISSIAVVATTATEPVVHYGIGMTNDPTDPLPELMKQFIPGGVIRSGKVYRICFAHLPGFESADEKTTLDRICPNRSW